MARKRKASGEDVISLLSDGESDAAVRPRNMALFRVLLVLQSCFSCDKCKHKIVWKATSFEVQEAFATVLA